MQKRNKTENLFLQFLRHPHDLVVFEDTILWTDRAANKVRRCNKYSCEDKDMIGLKMEKPLGIVINHPVRQKNGGYIFQVFWLSLFSVIFTQLENMSHVIRKPTSCTCENKDTDQLRGNREADQRLCFRYTNSKIPLLSKAEISSL